MSIVSLEKEHYSATLSTCLLMITLSKCLPFCMQMVESESSNLTFYNFRLYSKNYEI